MDNYLEPFLSSSSSSSWVDTHAAQMPSWVETAASQPSDLLAGPVGVYGGDGENQHIFMIPSSHIMGNLSTHQSNVNLHDVTSSIFVGGNLKYGPNKFPTGNGSQEEIPNHISVPSQHEREAHERSFSLQGVIESNPTAGTFGPELDTSCVVTLPHGALTESGSMESNGSELSVFPQSLGDSHSISTVSQLWPSSYSSVSSLAIEQGKLEGFGLRGELMESDGIFPTVVNEHNNLHNPHLPSFDVGSQMNLTGSVAFQPHRQDQDELQNNSLLFASGPQRTFTRTAGLQTHQQLSQSGEGISIKHYTNHSPTTQSQPAPASAAGSNGVVKARVRARRGQATDPHSIAERLRREKIAERMKNLQELVPNSNKTDKTSMLDEIIDYVKFLQLQVKVLSMSRLGAAGAVVPLITDIQAEGSSGLLLGREGDLSESQDNLAFEQEVVKLMESNVTTAMQYLQNKGLCLMPIALAAAISGRKGSSAAIPPERRKPETTQGIASQYNEQIAAKNWDAGVDAPDCNGAVLKQEEAQKSACSIRELKPEA